MTQHFTSSGIPPNPPSTEGRDAEIFLLPTHHEIDEHFYGITYDMDGNAHEETTEIWQAIDASMSAAEVTDAVESINVQQIMRGVENSDRPLRLTEWILQQAKVSPDYQGHVARMHARKELGVQFRSRLTPPEVKKKLREKIERIHDLTIYEREKIDRGRRVYRELVEAVGEMDAIKTKLKEQELNDENPVGIGLLDVLNGYEHVMKPKIANANVIRIYNSLFDKLHTPDDKVPSSDLIIARRILIMFMKRRLSPGTDESTDDQS